MTALGEKSNWDRNEQLFDQVPDGLWAEFVTLKKREAFPSPLFPSTVLVVYTIRWKFGERADSM